jgi:hypothetical protein
MISPTLPNWPPPDGKEIGVERARQYVAWIREHAPQVLEEAELLLQERYPGAEIHRSAATVGMLATRGLSERMQGLAIGCVWCSFMAGSFAMVDIVITREGRLVAKPGLNMR